MIEISKKRLLHLLQCNAGKELKLITVGPPIQHYEAYSGQVAWEETNEQFVSVPCEMCNKIRKLLK